LSIEYEGLESKLSDPMDEDLPPGVADAEDVDSDGGDGSDGGSSGDPE